MNSFCVVHVLYHHVHVLKFMNVIFNARAMSQSHHIVSRSSFLVDYSKLSLQLFAEIFKI